MYARLLRVAGLALLLPLFPAVMAAHSAPAGGATGLKPGTYKGEAKEEAEGQAFKGTISLKIPSLGKGGKVSKAEVAWSNGLTGMGVFSGTLDKTGNLKLAGTVVDSTARWQWHVTLSAKVRDTTITGKYSYRGMGGAIDGDGEFKAELEGRK